MAERQLLTIDPETVTIVDRELRIISARDKDGGRWLLDGSARKIIVREPWTSWVINQRTLAGKVGEGEKLDPETKMAQLIDELGMVDVTKAQQALYIERVSYPGQDFCLGVAVSNDPRTGKILYDNTDLGVWRRVPAVPVLGSEVQAEVMGGGHA